MEPVSMVRLNVGGKLFEVSRSLIDQNGSSPVLSRMVSETWQKDPNSVVFIDRDGEHFRHVLHFLRYGHVSLPATVAKASFLEDMDFYGIQAPDASIDDHGVTAVARKRVAMLEHHCQSDLAEIYSTRRKHSCCSRMLPRIPPGT